jgi:hypothetical protein
MNEHVERLLKSLEKTLEVQLNTLPSQYEVTKGQLRIIRLIQDSIETMKPYLK